MPTTDHYNSLDDFLVSRSSTVDAEAELGSLSYPVKGREIEATILFSDISGYSARTLDLKPVETLAFLNHFFTWVTAMALRGTHGIVDKYIGDEMMIIFSSEFSSDDPFGEAVQVARRMSDQDVFGFVPHIGIASGHVIVGYVGTPVMYNSSVFGAPVALAARCAGNVPGEGEDSFPPYSCSVTFPAAEWNDRDFNTLFPPTRYVNGEGHVVTEHPTTWELLPTRTMTPKNMSTLQIMEVIDHGIYWPGESAEETAKRLVREARVANRYWPNSA